MAETITVQVVESCRCGDEILMVRFERPNGYSFRAGQWFRLTLDTELGVESRTFSHASTPADDWIELTTRLSDSAFKRTLQRLSPGDSAGLGPSGGRLTLAEDADFVAFLAGGVGIAPLRSMLRDAAQRGRQFRDAVLFYGNRDDTCEPYLSEFEAMAEQGVRVVRVLERAPTGWEGETGFITGDIVSRYAQPLDGRQFFIAGPPPMVSAMDSLLDELGVDADLRHEETFGTPSLPHR